MVWVATMGAAATMPGPFSRRPGSCWKALAGAVGALIMMAAVGVAVLAGIGLIAPWNVK